MKNLLQLLILLFFFSCATGVPTSTAPAPQVAAQEDDEEWDVVVSDPQYDVFLKTVAKPENYYSIEHYKYWNKLNVDEWNRRAGNPFSYNPDIYLMTIDYDPSINYGLKFEYKLYNFFEYMKWKYKVNLGFGR